MGDDFEDIYAQSAATQAEPDFLQGDDGAANAEKPGGEDMQRFVLRVAEAGMPAMYVVLCR